MRFKVCFLLATLCLIIWSGPGLVNAQDVKAMEREANGELRNAQNLMFSGKLEESEAALKRTAELLEAIKAQDPASTQLKSLEQRLQRQRTDLDRRLSSAVTPEPAAGSAPGVAPGKRTDTGEQSATSRALPRNTRQEMLTLTRAIQSLETTEKDRLERIQAGDSHHMQQMESTLNRIQEKLDELPGLYAQLLSAAEKESAADHPDIAQAKTRIEQVSVWAKQEMAAARTFSEKAESKRSSAARDAQQLKQLFDETRSHHFDPIGNLMHAYQPEDIVKAFSLLESYNGIKGDLEKTLAAYEAKYGKTRDEIVGSTGGMDNVYPWQNFKENMKTMEEVPIRLASKIKETIESNLASLERRHDFFRIQGHGEIRRLAGYQKQYAPNAPAVADLDKILAEDMKKYEARIDQRTWPACKGKRSDRSAALKYFQDTWGKDSKRNYTVLSTVITGDWSVQQRDIAGRPVMYGLPVLLAVQTPEDKSRQLVRVFILTVRTHESGNAKMEPPFTSDTVGDSYFVRAKNVK
jgi:hypothetical protein